MITQGSLRIQPAASRRDATAQSQRAAAGRGWVSRKGSHRWSRVVSGLAATLFRQWSARRTAREFSRLSPRLRDDLGLPPGGVVGSDEMRFLARPERVLWALGGEFRR